MAWGVLDFGFGGVFSSWDIRIGGDDPRELVLKDYIKNNYSSIDCITLDKNLKELKDSLAYLKAEKLNGYKMPLNSRPKFIQESFSYFLEFMNKKAPDWYKKVTDINSYYGSKLGDSILPYAILMLENANVKGDCRNKIEQIRLDESGMILTQQSAKSEQNFLKENNKEQYIYIGAGALVLLVGVYVILKK
jgi:hypothetical protein